MSPSVPKLVRTMRMRCFCSLNADHERIAKGRWRQRELTQRPAVKGG
jgi:hypothetical protein